MPDHPTEDIPEKSQLWAFAAQPVLPEKPQKSPKPVLRVTDGLELFQNASPTADGYAKWKQEQTEARLAFQKQWGIPLGKQVRLKLKGELSEREGQLFIVEEPKGNVSDTLKLKIGDHVFLATKIQSLVRITDE